MVVVETTEASERTADRHWVIGMAQRFSSKPEFWCVIHAGQPIVKSRARVVRGGSQSYTPAKTRTAQSALAATLRGGVAKFTGNVAIVCLFRRANRQRLDVDNLLKLVLDAGTQAELWDDDSQVTALVGVLDYDKDDPRTTIAFTHHESRMRRGQDAQARCVVCDAPFDNYGVPSRRHCSRECRMTLAEPKICPSCQQPFKRRTEQQVYCSNACRYEAQKQGRTCATCGSPRARRGSKLCRACWLATTGQRVVVEITPVEDL